MPRATNIAFLYEIERLFFTTITKSESGLSNQIKTNPDTNANCSMFIYTLLFNIKHYLSTMLHREQI